MTILQAARHSVVLAQLKRDLRIVKGEKSRICRKMIGKAGGLWQQLCDQEDNLRRSISDLENALSQ
ncbi:hypothetical protein [Hymenobacter sp. B81]|uniref:hypothetical protein n=1 Tax=Hymenobacter sp. B81 TaxID=3344878 RepID=UPI0037DC3B8E